MTVDSALHVDDKKNALALVPKLYQKNLYRSLLNKKFGLKPSTPHDFYGPEVVEFDPTTACNLGCPECISGSLLGAGGFSRSSILSILDSFVKLNVKAVVLIGGGEPMMHPMIEEIISFLHEHDIHVGITTNGLFIEKYLDLIAAKVSWIRVSVDAATKDTFKKVRPDKFGNSLFDELIRQMRLLGRHPDRKCTFGYSMLLLTRFRPAVDSPDEVEFTNVTELYDAAKLAKDIGCDYFEAKPSFDEYHFHLSHPAQLMYEAKSQLSAAMSSLADNTFEILTATNLFDILECQPTEQPKEYSSCPVTNLRTLVSPSGVFPCPYFRGDKTRSYGDPTRESLLDIWSSQQKQDVQEKLDPSRDCRFHCIRHRTNLELIKLGDMPSPVSEDMLTEDYNRFF